jgi:hypothetical protein
MRVTAALPTNRAIACPAGNDNAGNLGICHVTLISSLPGFALEFPVAEPDWSEADLMRRESTCNPEEALRRDGESVEVSSCMSLIHDINLSPFSTRIFSSLTPD